jgi:CheY-like chemotaxis protein
MNPSDPKHVAGVESADLRGVNILLVEDDWQLGTALKSHLQSLGADVLGLVATTAEAERLVGGQSPDVALVDFNLRGGERPNGLIQLLQNRGIRVVVISGYAAPPLSSKVDAVLQKPVSEEQLIETLRQLVTANR